MQHLKLHQYADDTQVYYSFQLSEEQNATECINNDLQSIHRYSKNHGLILNSNKSSIIYIGSNFLIRSMNNHSLNININGDVIPVVKTAKNLGVTFDQTMKFTEHISLKFKCAYFRLKKLFSFKNYLSVQMKLRLVDVLVLPIIEYGDVVYSSSLDFQTRYKVQKLQNACLRFVFDIPYREHITPFLTKHNILNMTNRRLLHFYAFLFRLLKNNEPLYLISRLIMRLNPYQIRSITFEIPSHTTSNFKKSFSYLAPKFLNDLQDIVPCHDYNSNMLSKIRSYFLETQLMHRPI